MNEAQMTLVGNLVDDPELRFTPAGQPVARFRIASTPRYQDSTTGEWKDGDTLFLTCIVWRQPAENVAESLTRGHAGHRHRAAAAAVVRDQGRREADRLRAPGRRARPIAAERLGQGARRPPAPTAARRRPRSTTTAPTRGPASPAAAATNRRSSREPQGAPALAVTCRGGCFHVRTRGNTGVPHGAGPLPAADCPLARRNPSRAPAASLRDRLRRPDRTRRAKGPAAVGMKALVWEGRNSTTCKEHT